VPVDYSRLAADYDAVRGSDEMDRGYWFPGLVEAAHLRAGDRILDLGAGTGRFSQYAAEIGQVVAVDSSVDMLSRAREKGLFPVVRADAHALPFRDDMFDAALIVMVLHQLADFPRALREVRRISRRVAIATSDMRTRTLCLLDDAFPSLLKIDRGRFPPIQRIVEALSAAGFRTVSVGERPYRRIIPVDQELDRVRRKYISTFDLLPPGEFERGLAFLERELPKGSPGGFDASATFTFVGASR